jgi:hypothetical protein
MLGHSVPPARSSIPMPMIEAKQFETHLWPARIRLDGCDALPLRPNIRSKTRSVSGSSRSGPNILRQQLHPPAPIRRVFFLSFSRSVNQCLRNVWRSRPRETRVNCDSREGWVWLAAGTTTARIRDFEIGRTEIAFTGISLRHRRRRSVPERLELTAACPVPLLRLRLPLGSSKTLNRPARPRGQPDSPQAERSFEPVFPASAFTMFARAGRIKFDALILSRAHIGPTHRPLSGTNLRPAIFGGQKKNFAVPNVARTLVAMQIGRFRAQPSNPVHRASDRINLRSRNCTAAAPQSRIT